MASTRARPCDLPHTYDNHRMRYSYDPLILKRMSREHMNSFRGHGDFYNLEEQWLHQNWMGADRPRHVQVDYCSQPIPATPPKANPLLLLTGV